jgi:hypothetical protein
LPRQCGMLSLYIGPPRPPAACCPCASHGRDDDAELELARRAPLDARGAPHRSRAGAHLLKRGDSSAGRGGLSGVTGAAERRDRCPRYRSQHRGAPKADPPAGAGRLRASGPRRRRARALGRASATTRLPPARCVNEPRAPPSHWWSLDSKVPERGGTSVRGS